MKPRRRMLILFLLPAVLSYLFVFFYPTLQTIYFSFFELDQFVGATPEFRGVSNYTDLARTPLFLESFKNIVIVWLVGGIVIFALAFLFTGLLTSGIRGKSFFRAMIYLPNIINVVALTTLWTQYIYNPTYGLLHSFFNFIGLEALAKIQWTSLDMLFWSMLIAFCWGSVGWFMLIILAGAERIPTDYFEAARLDGANIFQVFFQITLPLLRDVLRVTLVMWSVASINLFAFPKTFTPVVQQKGTLTPAIYLYQLAFGIENSSQGLQIGRAAAVGVILLVLVLVTAAVISRVFRQSEFQY